MASPPYNPETGAWTVFGDPRPAPSAQGANQSAVVFMAPTRPEALTTQAVLTGDIKEASKFIPLARQQMTLMHQINVNDLEIYNRPVDLGGGRFMNCQRNFTADRAHIHVPGGGKGSLGALHLNFDPSVMDDFGLQTIFDKNHGLPLYMNEFSNVSLAPDGLNFGSLSVPVEQDRSAQGAIYYNDESGQTNGRTFFVPIKFNIPFKQVDTGPGGIIQLPGGGYAYYSQYCLSPINSFGMNCWAYNTVGPGESEGLRSVFVVRDQNGDISSEINYYNQTSGGAVLSISSRGVDLSYGEYGDVSSTRINSIYIDGSKVLESETTGGGWGSYYPGNRSRFDFDSYTNGNSAMSIGQKMLYAAHLDDSQIREVTDNLAAKWGF